SSLASRSSEFPPSDFQLLSMTSYPRRSRNFSAALMAFSLSSDMIDLLGYRRFAPLAFRLVKRGAHGFCRGRKGGKRRRAWKEIRSGVFRKVLPASNALFVSGKSFRETDRKSVV